MPTPEELYGNASAAGAPVTAPGQQPSAAPTPATGGQQTYIPPEDLYGQPVNQGDGQFWNQLKEDLPAMAGATALAIPMAAQGAAIGATIGSAVPVVGTGAGAAIGSLVGGATGAFIGGAGGKGYQQVYREVTGDPKAPADSYEAAVEMTKAGGEQAAWEIGGQLVGRGLGKAIYYLRPKAVEGIEKLNVALQNAGGKGFTAAQRTDSWMVHQLDSLTRGSMTGSGIMKSADMLNDQALKLMEGDIRQNIAKNVTDNLSPREIGNLFIDTVNGGQAAHKTAVQNMYESFDTLVPPKIQTVTQQVGVDAAGNPITKSVQVAVPPVDATSIKASMAPFRDQLERINYVGETPETRRLLESVTNLPDKLSFSDAQALRSNLLDAQRNLEGNLGKTKITGKVNTIVDQLTKSMDDAALSEGAQTAAKYQAIKRFAATGYKAFNDDFVIDLLKAGKANPADIGAQLFKAGNEQEIINAKKALRYAATFDKTISYDKTWGQMQAGYLNDILTRNSKLAEVSPLATQQTLSEGMQVSGKDLLKEFTDPKKARVLNRTFSPEQREGILNFAKVAERLQRKPQGGLGMVAAISQGGFIAGMMTGAFQAGKAASLFLSPYALARIMTNPKGARVLAIALETPAKSPKASQVMARLAAEYYKANQDQQEGEAQQPQQQGQ